MSMAVSSAANDELVLTPGQQQVLLHLAREAVSAVACGEALPAVDVQDHAFWELRAVFVTLRLRPDPHDGADTRGVGPLRGCIGQIEAISPLALAVQEAATRAATIDPRFPPVRPHELNDITIEISILSDFRPVGDELDIHVGRDGLLVAGSGRRGLLLPQVATLYGFDAAEFVANTCRKAGLPATAWPGEAQLWAFTTTTIAESGAEIDTPREVREDH